MSDLEVFNSCPIGVIGIDEARKIIYCNEEFTRCFGYTLAELTAENTLCESLGLNFLSQKTYINDLSEKIILVPSKPANQQVPVHCSFACYNDKIIIYLKPLLPDNFFNHFLEFPNEVVAFSGGEEILFQNGKSIEKIGDLKGFKLGQIKDDTREFSVWHKLLSQARRQMVSVNQVYYEADDRLEKTYRALCLPVYLSNELVTYVILKMHMADVWTTRKEEYLEQLKLLMESTNIHFVLRNLSTKEIEYISPSFRKFWGPDVVRLKKDFGAVIEEAEIGGREMLAEKYRKHLSGEKPFLHEIKLKHPDGNPRWVKVKMGLIKDGNGDVSKEYWIIEDVTNKKVLKSIIKKRENTIARIQSAINNKLGKENLDNLNFYLADALGADFFLLAENIDDEKIRVVSGYAVDGTSFDNYEFLIKNTPCEMAVKTSLCLYKSNVASLFPKDKLLSKLGINGFIGVDLQNSQGTSIGLLVGLYRDKIKEPEFAKTLITLFSSRAEAELERLNLDRSLKEREERYAHALEVGEFGILDIDIESGRINANNQFLKIAELSHVETKEMMIGFISEHIHPECLEDFYRMKGELFSGEKDAAEFELRIVTKSGNTKWVSGKHKTISKYPDGKPKRVLSLFRDVTALHTAEDQIRLSLKREKDLNKKLKKSESELRGKVAALKKLNEKLGVSEARWSYALEGNGDTVWDLNLSNHKLYLSDKYYALLGHSRKRKYESLTFFVEKIHPDYRNDFESEVNLCSFAPYPTLIQEVMIRNKDEDYIWVLIRGKVVEINEGDGTPLRMVGTITDLSGIKMMKRELSIYEEMIKQNQNGIVLTDLDGYIDYMNNTAYELLKYKQHEVLYRSLSVLDGNGEKGFAAHLIKSVLSEGSWNDEAILAGAHGDPLEVHISASLLRDEQNEPHGIVINFKDITEKVKLERNITKLEREKLNSELEYQKKITEVMIEVQEAEKAKLAKELHDGIGQMLNLIKLKAESIDLTNCSTIPMRYTEIKDMLGQTLKDLKNITYDLMPLNLQQLGLEGSINLLLNNYKSALNTAIRIKSKVRINSSLSVPGTVSTHVYRIAQESINNSVKYAQAKNISLMLITIKGKLHLFVEDDGIGFSYNEAFDKTYSFGLKNIQERAKLIDGRLLIDTAPGKGFTLSLTVPLNR